jgi:hypothetical protein
MDMEPTHQFGQLHLAEEAEPISDTRTPSEITQAFQAENQQLKAENKRLDTQGRHWKGIAWQRKDALTKHGEKMHSMNQRFFKLSKLESQLQKLQKIVGEALEPVEETECEGIVEDLVDGEEVKLQKGKGKKRKTKNEGEEEGWGRRAGGWR